MLLEFFRGMVAYLHHLVGTASEISSSSMHSGIIFPGHVLVDEISHNISSTTSLPLMKGLSRSHEVIERVCGVGGAQREGRRSWGGEAPSSQALLAIRQKKKVSCHVSSQLMERVWGGAPSLA